MASSVMRVEVEYTWHLYSDCAGSAVLAVKDGGPDRDTLYVSTPITEEGIRQQLAKVKGAPMFGINEMKILSMTAIGEGNKG